MSETKRPSELVHWLRDQWAEDYPECVTGDFALAMCETADEVERLQVENAELRAKLANGFGRNGPAPPLPSFVTDSMSQISDSEGG